MKQTFKLLLLAIPLIFQVAYAQNSMNHKLTALRNSLAENAVPCVIVLRMPDDVTTRVAVTPQVLRQLPPPTRKFVIKMSASRSTLLIRWTKEVKLTPTEQSPDLRWGLLFMGRDGKELASIFSDRFGNIGTLNGHNVKFSGTSVIGMIHALVGPQVH